MKGSYEAISSHGLIKTHTCIQNSGQDSLFLLMISSMILDIETQTTSSLFYNAVGFMLWQF